MVSKARIPPKQIDGAKKETGGSAVLKGVCYGENGTLVFEMAKPAAPNVAAVTKNVLKAKAGLAIKVEYRVGRDEETIPESAEPDLPSDDAGKAVPGADGAAAEAQGAADLDAEWKAKLAAWTPAIKAALAARGPNAAAIGKLLAQATALSKPGGDMAQALAKLAECHNLSTASAAPPAPPKAVGGDPAAEWKAKLAEWTPAIKTALAAKGPNAGDIGKLLAQATALSKPGGDMAQALAKLTECHALASAAPPKGAGGDTAQWTAKLAEWTPAIKAALAAKGPNAATIGKLLAQATALSKPGGDMAQALAKLTECHNLSTAGAAPPAPPKATADPAAAEWKAKLAERTPAIKAALAAKGPNAVAIGKLLAQATALSKPGGDMAQALAKLTECHALATAGTPPSPSADGRSALVKRLNGLAGAIKAALTGPNASRVQTLSGAVSRLLKNNDIAQARRMLDEMEPLLGGARASSGAGAGAVPRVGKQVAFAQAKIRWNQAKDGVRQQLEKLHKKILEEFNDPESADATKKLKKVLERFNEGLGDALDDLYVAEEPQQPALRTRVGDIAAKYLAYVRDDPLVLHVEDNPFMDVTVQATLERPLLDLQAQLAAR